MDTKFDIKKFHEKVLESGVMPLALRERDWCEDWREIEFEI